MVDLERLCRWPDPAYATVQFGSSDRRTVAPDQPGWFANADGFGQEPVPNFAEVLRAPGDDGTGEYLVCDVAGPGAIVRGWSAGMDGVLRVWLDGGDEPLFTGKGYDFFARRSSALVHGFAALPEPVRALLQQEDADYLPVPFAERLRVTWTGRVRDLHFYQLQVRRYEPGADVRTAAAGDFAIDPARLRRTEAGAALFAAGQPGQGGDAGAAAVAFALAPGGTVAHELRAARPAVLRELTFRLRAAEPGRALRSVLLRITCDGASVPQVEAPLGDFFATFAGFAPHRSLPLEVHEDGTLVCRWPMPFAQTLRIELIDASAAAAAPVRAAEGPVLAGTLLARAGDLAGGPGGGFDERTLHFHARWRVDHGLHARARHAPIDLPYLTALGRGRLVGLGCQIVNPPMAPDWRGNWWGEGDEKIFVDGELTTLGTGSEDYFNYSWSHWRWFAHPYCGQPVSSGPGNCGYVANHRFQILDDLPFAQSLAAAMELWSHRPVHPLSYGRIAWFYARPGAVTDHRRPQPDELRLPALLPWDDGAFADQDAVWRPGERGYVTRDGAVAPAEPDAWTRSGAILLWTAPPGGELLFPFQVDEQALYRLRLCCRQRPDAPAVQVLVDGVLQRRGAEDTFSLRCRHGQRFEDLAFETALAPGSHALALRCPEGGVVGIDLIGCELAERPPVALPGAVDAELWELVASSPGVEVEIQRLGSAWSGAHQRWVKATRAGDAATFRLAAPAPGRYRVVLRLTTSWDYGIVRVDWNGEVAAAAVDLWCGERRELGVREVDLGERDLTRPARLTFTVTGHAPGNAAPHHYFGVDCAVLSPL